MKATVERPAPTRSETGDRIRSEHAVPLAEAVKFVPLSRDRDRISPASLLRWIISGKRGIRLEAVRVKGQWHTSAAAVGRFLAALNAKSTVDRHPRRLAA